MPANLYNGRKTVAVVGSVFTASHTFDFSVFFDHKILEDIVKDPDIDTWSEYWNLNLV